MQRRKATGSIAETARATIEPVAALTAALVSFLDGDTEPTARDIYAIEAIADHLRRGLNRHNATMAICSLLDALPLTAGDRQAVEKFLHQSKR